jgi:hypothetical protein
MNPVDFEFTVVEQVIQKKEEGQRVEIRYPILEISPSDGRFVDYTKSVWHKALLAVKGHCEVNGQGAPGWVDWNVVGWSTRNTPSADVEQYAAWHGDTLAGFLNIWKNQPRRSGQPGEKVLYIEHIAAAPWDLPTPLWTRRLRNVGIALIAYSVLRSFLTGTDGWLGLHVSDGEAMEFYQKLNRQYGDQLIAFSTTNIQGVLPPRPGREDRMLELRYLEMSGACTKNLLENFRRA